MKDKKNLFFDESLSFEERLDWLLSEMTPEEKMQCLASTVPDIERLGIQGFSVGGEAAHGVEARNDQNGIGKPEPTTSFPQPIGMSASWDKELIRKAGKVTGREARVLYHRHPRYGLSRWAPTVDMERDPRWGRTEEAYGEDPVLTGEMASAYVQGLQGNHPKYLRTAATLKHFYGNNTEVGRGYKSSSIDPRNQMEYYLEPFRRVIEKGKAEAVMTAYNKINGIPGMLNPQVKEILKDTYGLKHVVCDGGAMELVVTLHKYYGIHAETIANAIKAGVDAMSDSPELVAAAAKEAYDLKLLTEEEMDQALRNMFRTKLRLGIYDAWDNNPYNQVTEEDLNSEMHKEICRQMSRESIVLLKNEQHTLPLDIVESEEEIALIGPMADMWYPDWYGGTPPYTRTLKKGIEDVLKRKVTCTDARDRVIFRCNGKGISIAEDGRLQLSDTPDIFVKDEWGEGNFTFQSERTGKFVRAKLPKEEENPKEKGEILADQDTTLDWFVMEIFHMEKLEDGQIYLTERFGSPVQLTEEGYLISMQEEGEPVKFQMEVIENGLEKAIKTARNHKKILLALGCNPMINGKEEVDRKTINLPPAQQKLLEEISQVNPNTVLILLSNYPYAIHTAQEHLPAILWSATGSQEMGSAVAETIFGLSAPAGKLNMTWYCSDDQLPDIDDYDIIKGKRTYRYFDGKVLYPFGHGLTYSPFNYSDFSVQLEDHTMLNVSLSIQNTGNRKSDEVVQIYGTAPASRVVKPRRQLLGFERVKDVAPQETRRVQIKIPVTEFYFYDVISKTKIVEEGIYKILAGFSSEDIREIREVWIPGSKTGYRHMEERTAADHYDTYENIYLTEGQFGYTAARTQHSDRMGILVYKDCQLEEKTEKNRAILLHMKSENPGLLEIYINDKKAGEYRGESDLYRNIKIELEEDEIEVGKAFTLEIHMDKNISLCYFEMF